MGRKRKRKARLSDVLVLITAECRDVMRGLCSRLRKKVDLYTTSLAPRNPPEHEKAVRRGLEGDEEKKGKERKIARPRNYVELLRLTHEDIVLARELLHPLPLRLYNCRPTRIRFMPDLGLMSEQISQILPR